MIITLYIVFSKHNILYGMLEFISLICLCPVALSSVRRRQHLTTTDRKIKLYYPVDHSGVTDISAYIYITTPLHALNSLLILYSLVYYSACAI